MTEPGPFTPPGGTPPLPPPTGAPIGVTPTPAITVAPPQPMAPPPSPRRPWLIPVIIGGSLLLVGLIAGVAIVAVQLATWVGGMPTTSPPVAGAPLDDLLEGDPGSPVAVDPLDCVVCFEMADARTLSLPAEAYAAAGLPNGDGDVYEVAAGDDQLDNSKWWKSDGGTPDECYFAYTTSPLFFAPGDPDNPTAERDRVYYPEWHYDEAEYYAFTEAVRVFDQTSSATAHLAQLESAIAGCPDYAYTETGWYGEVTAAPALDLPDSVAAYGWAESSGVTRFYGVDLQRGNLVARLTLWSDADGPSEAEFRELAEAYAVLLAELDPAG